MPMITAYLLSNNPNSIQLTINNIKILLLLAFSLNEPFTVNNYTITAKEIPLLFGYIE